MDIAHLRKDYTRSELNIQDVAENPIKQFQVWLEEAIKVQIHEPTIMHLSTASTSGRPSGRIVLLKGVDTGFIFYTNYKSRKGKEVFENPFAALTFHWQELERQVRIEGKVEKVSTQLSDTYFKSRPLGSQIGAIASPQSQAIPNREWLLDRVAKTNEKETIERPEHWGGYRVVPDKMEFWQGKASRLHDRICYTWENNLWNIERLAP